jgi:hypothetical protein
VTIFWPILVFRMWVYLHINCVAVAYDHDVLVILSLYVFLHERHSEPI